MQDLRHRLASTAAVPAAVVLGALGAVRRARAFHPTGVALTGTWTAPDDLIEPLTAGRPWPVVVRLSKGVGLPGTLPDVLGLAIRIVDLYGEGEHQDLLLSTSGASGIGRSMLRPTRDHAHAPYSSLVPYDTPVGRGALWARTQVDDGTEAVRTLDEAAALAMAGRLSYVVGVGTDERDRLLGEVHLHERLADDAGEGLRFDPTNAGPMLCPTGPLQELRERAYRASQRFRPTPEPDARATDEAVEQEAVGQS